MKELSKSIEDGKKNIITTSLEINFNMINNNNEKKEELKSHIYQILKNFNQSLSSKQIYRYLVRKKILNPKYYTWSTIYDIIREEIKKNKEKSLFFEEKLGIFGIREWEIKEIKSIIYYPNALIIFEDQYIIVKEKTCYFIPELSSYFKILDVDEKRDYFETEEFKWRLKNNILNLNNRQKKEKFFFILEKSYLKNKDFDNSDINLILDLNNNQIYYDTEAITIDKIIDLSYDAYDVLKLDSKDFQEKIKYYLDIYNTI